MNASNKSFFSTLKNSRLLANGTLIIIMLLLLVFLSIATSGFMLTWKNIYNLLRQTSINGIVAIGMTFVIISGGIDLSVGSMVGFSGMLAAILLRDGTPVIWSILAALVASAALGAVNGIVVYKGKVPPFIATLGMMTVVRAVIMLISGAAMVAGLPREFTDIAQIDLFGSPTTQGIPVMALVWLGIILIAWFVTRLTVFGRNVYAIGSNVESSRLSGISVGRVTVGVYTLCALFSGVAGIIFVSRIGNGVPTGGQGYELEAIAAAVIGGASLSGAEGSVFGTVIGAIIMQMLRNGGNLLSVNPFILEIIIGSLIVITVLIDQNSKKRKV